MTIFPLNFKDIPSEIISEGRRNRLIFRDKPNARYFGGFVNGTLISLVCLVINKDRTGSIKSNYTLPEYRRRGYFTELNKYCLNFAREHGVRSIILNCLKDSVGIHTRAGAQVWKTTKNIFWMIYRDNQKWPE